MTRSAILSTIDAAVADLCACGCGQPLPADGPSGWFATPWCQQRWHERAATDPTEVYLRPDAALYPLRDSAPQRLLEPKPPWIPTPTNLAAFDEGMRHIQAAFQEMARQMATSFVALRTWIDELHTLERERRARLRRMHTEYSRRRA